MRAKIGHLILGFTLALLGLLALDAHAEYTVVGAGIRRVLVDWVYQPTGVSELNFSGFTSYRDGGTLTVVSGGGVGDGSVAELNLSGALSASLVHYNDAGVIQGYLTGSSAYTTVGYADGGLSDGSANVVARGRLAFSPGSFYLEDNPDAGSTVVQALPSFGSEIRNGSVNTTAGSATQCTDFVLPDGATAVAWLILNASSYDGGGVNSATYVRLGTFERSDGGIPTLIGGAFSTVGTDREDDTSWTGAGAPTYDGGVVQVTVSGAAGQTISWDCYLQLFYRPRLTTPRPNP